MGICLYNKFFSLNLKSQFFTRPQRQYGLFPKLSIFLSFSISAKKLRKSYKKRVKNNYKIQKKKEEKDKKNLSQSLFLTKKKQTLTPPRSWPLALTNSRPSRSLFVPTLNTTNNWSLALQNVNGLPTQPLGTEFCKFFQIYMLWPRLKMADSLSWP